MLKAFFFTDVYVFSSQILMATIPYFHWCWVVLTRLAVSCTWPKSGLDYDFLRPFFCKVFPVCNFCPHLRILQFKSSSQKLVDVIWHFSLLVKMLMLQLLRKTNLGLVKQNNDSLVNKCLYDCS